jgi:PhnB protein
MTFAITSPDGSYLHAALLKNGNEIFAVSESKDIKIQTDMINAQWPTMSYRIDFESEKEVQDAYQIIKVHGHVLREIGLLSWSLLSADVVDKFGIYWYLYLPQK